jgi:hypothetical protein
LLGFPATTRQGINFQVTQRSLPAGIKAADFIVRDYEYRRLAGELTRGAEGAEAKTEALLRWTHANIRPTPPGWPVVDDHISHIIIRGYGQEDQMADVFSTLSTYAGVPSFWKVFDKPSMPARLILSFAKISGRWTVWDVPVGIAFRHPQGGLASVEEVAADPDLIRFAGTRAPRRAHWYLLYLPEGLAKFSVPQPLRAEKQMPLRRILFELRRAGDKLLGRSPTTDE